MKQKKIPLRMCIITRERLEKKDLFRIVRTPSNEILLDNGGRINGKGAYLKKDISIINKAKTHKIVDKVLEVEIPECIYEEMIKIIEKEGEVK